MKNKNDIINAYNTPVCKQNIPCVLLQSMLIVSGTPIYQMEKLRPKMAEWLLNVTYLESGQAIIQTLTKFTTPCCFNLSISDSL